MTPRNAGKWDLAGRSTVKERCRPREPRRFDSRRKKNGRSLRCLVCNADTHTLSFSLSKQADLTSRSIPFPTGIWKTREDFVASEFIVLIVIDRSVVSQSLTQLLSWDLMRSPRNKVRRLLARAELHRVCSLVLFCQPRHDAIELVARKQRRRGYPDETACVFSRHVPCDRAASRNSKPEKNDRPAKAGLIRDAGLVAIASLFTATPVHVDDKFE